MIRRNQVRINQERNYFKEQLAREASEYERRARLLDQMDKEAQATRKREQEDLLNDLTNNTKLSSSEVLARHKKILQDEKSKTQFESKLMLSDFCTQQAEQYVASQLNEPDDPSFVYEPIAMDIGGPDVPAKSSIFDLGYLTNVRDSAPRDLGGGYNSVIACERALNDAFGGLFLKPNCTANDS